MEREAVIIGAGRIGRGFLAEVFLSAGCRLTMVDASRELVDGLRARGHYTIYKAMAGGLTQERVWGYDALHTSEEGTIADRLCTRGAIAAVAVLPQDLPETAQLLAVCIAQKALLTPDEPLDILLCLNMIDPVESLRDQFESLLGGTALDYLRAHVGLVSTVVMRMSPPTPPELLAVDPLGMLNNGYPELVVDRTAFKGEAPMSPMVRLSSDIMAEEARKFYTLNMLHASMAYLGAACGFTLAVDALNDRRIRPLLKKTLEEAATGLCGEYGFHINSMREWNRRLLATMDNALLGDRVERLGADSARKLAANDRLVGIANLCLKHGGIPEALAQAIAQGYRFSMSGDAGTRRVLDSVATEGIEAAVERFSGLDMRHPLQEMVVSAYNNADKLRASI